MNFTETKTVLNDLLWRYNGNKEDQGLCRVTEAMGHSFDVVYNNNNIVNIQPSQFESKGHLAKYILNQVYD